MYKVYHRIKNEGGSRVRDASFLCETLEEVNKHIHEKNVILVTEIKDPPIKASDPAERIEGNPVSRSKAHRSLQKISSQWT